MLKLFRKYIKYNCTDNLPIPKVSFIVWDENKNKLSDKNFEKIYNQIKNRKIHYYINDYIIIGIIKTKDLGFVQLYISNDIYIKIYKTGISYNLNNVSSYKKLNDYINNFITIAKEQYYEDLNI